MANFDDLELMLKNSLNYIKTLEILRNLPNAARLADSRGRTLLHFAVDSNNLEIAGYLIESGARIDAQDFEGKTPLMLCASSFYHQRVVGLLLESNANIFIRDNHGKCAFQHACFIGRLKIFHKLIDIFSGDVEKIGLEFAQWECCGFFSLYLKSTELRRLLRARGCPLLCAVCQTILKETVLIAAVRNNVLDDVQIFLDYGIDVNEESPEGSTALSVYGSLIPERPASQDPAILRLLLDRGANPTMALTRRWISGKMQMYTILRYGKRDIVRMLLDRNVDMYARDANGCCAVHYLAENIRPHAAKELLGREFDVNARDNSGRTPLHYIRPAHCTNVNFLLDEGANVDAKDNHGITPLMKLWKEKNPLGRERLLDNPIFNMNYWYNIKRKIECLLCHGADAQAIVPTEADSFFANIEDGYGFYWIQPVLVQLALTEARGMPINSVIRDEIYRYEQPRKYFEKCTRQLEEMKGVKVWKSVSLYELLVARDVKIDIYLRNGKLLSNLRRIKNNKNTYIPYYIYVLRDRILRAVRIMRLRDRIAAILYETVGLCRMSHHTIVDKITYYLSERDLRKLYRKK